MFEDQTVELLPARTVMSKCYGGNKKQRFTYLANTGGAGGAGGAGGSGGNGGVALGGVAIAVNAGNINFGGTQYNEAFADASADASGGDGGAGGAGGAGGNAG